MTHSIIHQIICYNRELHKQLRMFPGVCSKMQIAIFVFICKFHQQKTASVSFFFYQQKDEHT